MNVEIGSKTAKVILKENENPEMVSKKIMTELNVDNGNNNNINSNINLTCELYKQLSEKYKKENSILQNRIMELKRQQHLNLSNNKSQSKEIYYENLLDKASKRIEN